MREEWGRKEAGSSKQIATHKISSQRGDGKREREKKAGDRKNFHCTRARKSLHMMEFFSCSRERMIEERRKSSPHSRTHLHACRREGRTEKGEGLGKKKNIPLLPLTRTCECVRERRRD